MVSQVFAGRNTKFAGHIHPAQFSDQFANGVGILGLAAIPVQAGWVFGPVRQFMKSSLVKLVQDELLSVRQLDEVVNQVVERTVTAEPNVSARTFDHCVGLLKSSMNFLSRDRVFPARK